MILNMLLAWGRAALARAWGLLSWPLLQSGSRALPHVLHPCRQMAELIRAAGSLLAGAGAVIAGVGVLRVSDNMDKIAERGLTNGLASHMSAANAGKHFGEKTFKALQDAA